MSKLFEKALKETDEGSILELGRKVVEDFESLNQILFQLAENFCDPRYKNGVLREMSKATDAKVRKLMNKIDLNLRRIADAIINEGRITPLDENDMDDVMVNIMFQYLVTSMNVKSNATIGENYSKEINEIHAALGELARSINDYNTMADSKRWPRIKTENEAFSTAKQRINSEELPDDIS